MLPSNHKWDDDIISVTIATRESPTVVLSILMEWIPNDVTLMTIVAMVTDLWCHWYRSMADSVCHMPSIFNDITNWNSFDSNFRFSKTNKFFSSHLIQFIIIFATGYFYTPSSFVHISCVSLSLRSLAKILRSHRAINLTKKILTKFFIKYVFLGDKRPTLKKK